MAKKKKSSTSGRAAKGTKKKAAKKGGAKSSTKKKSSTKASTKKAATKRTTKKKSSKRELIDTGRDKRYVRRDEQGQFDEVDDVGRSLSQDRRKKAKRKTTAGQGDRGDRSAR